jgi:uncharacterized membrane protein YczE
MLITLLMILVIGLLIGLLLWVINSYVPMDGNFKKVLTAVVIVGFVILSIMMLLGVIPTPALGRLD